MRIVRTVLSRAALFLVIPLALFLFSLPTSALDNPPADTPSAPTPIPPPAQTAPPPGSLAPLIPFGYDIFRPEAEQITEGPVDDLYVLSPGDEIIITVWGQLSLRYPLTISEDGFVDIPDQGGRVYTNGVSLRDLKRLVTESLAKINSTYINPQNPAQSTAFVDVKLAKARKILVYVVGEVNKQGPYTISSGVATLLNLLNNAGGVKTSGSLREIKIRRAGSTSGAIDTVDLYDFLLTGKIDTQKNQIRYGDYIIVPLKAKSVSIKGEIKRPGIYEVIGNEGLKSLIPFAGGLSSNAYLKRAQIKRFEMNAGEKYYDVDLEGLFAAASPSAPSPSPPAKDFPLTDRDEITVFPNVTVRRPIVEIQGSGVKRPGLYQFSSGMTIQNLIALAEGLKEGVFLGRADLVRTTDDLSKRLTIFSLQDLYKEETPGRYTFVGPPSSDKNFPLKELDVVLTYSAFEMRGKDKEVTIEGQVKEPGTYILAENTTLYDLVFSRGGFQDEDFRKMVFLELAHIFRKIPGELGEKVIPFNLGKLLDGDPTANFKLEGKDRIVTYSFETFRARQFATIDGLVNKPGEYPFVESLTLEDLILIAGGLRPDAYKTEAVIGRTGSRVGIISEVQTQQSYASIVVPVRPDYAILPQEQKTPLEPFDKITIRNLPGYEPQPVVSVEGQVVYPGSYTLQSRDERLSSLIKRAGGLKTEASAEGAVLYRRKDILTLGSTGASEKVAINLKQALDNPGGNFDLALKEGDRIIVPYNPGTVEVRGAVRNPGIFQFRKGKRLAYYLDLGGSYDKDADRKGIVVYHPNGIAASKGFLSGFEILPGSVVEVPFKGEGRQIEWVEVRGAVKNPIMVHFQKGQRLDYYLNLSGGYRDDADIENMAIRLGDETTLEHPKSGSFNPYVTAGSIIQVPFKAQDLEAERADVEVRGAVRNPGPVQYRKEAKLDFYIRYCGGYQANADLEKIVIRLPDGKTIEPKKDEKEFNPPVPPGSIVEVPVKQLQ